jgi:hypothetical protein
LRSCSSTVAWIGLLTEIATRHGAPATDDAGVEIRTSRGRACADATNAPHAPIAKAAARQDLPRPSM